MRKVDKSVKAAVRRARLSAIARRGRSGSTRRRKYGVLGWEADLLNWARNNPRKVVGAAMTAAALGTLGATSVPMAAASLALGNTPWNRMALQFGLNQLSPTAAGYYNTLMNNPLARAGRVGARVYSGDVMGGATEAGFGLMDAYNWLRGRGQAAAKAEEEKMYAQYVAAQEKQDIQDYVKAMNSMRARPRRR